MSIYVYRITFFGKIISQQGVSPDPNKHQVLIDMPPPKMKKELQLFLVILNYLNKILPVTAAVFESLCKLISVKQIGHGRECTKICMRKKKQ